MKKRLCVAVPFHGKAPWLKELFSSIRSDIGGDAEIIGIDDRSDPQVLSVAKEYCDLVIPGPGLCNWRPGAIHWPVMQAWLTTDCEYITYLFSDDKNLGPRYSRQIHVMDKNPALSGTYCGTNLIDPSGIFLKTIPPPIKVNFGGIPTFCEALVIRREPFEKVGGLDYPVHIAACAEAWIWSATGAAGKIEPVSYQGLGFRKHPDALSDSGKSKYAASVAKTKYTSEHHRKLWSRIQDKFIKLCHLASYNNR